MKNVWFVLVCLFLSEYSQAQELKPNRFESELTDLKIKPIQLTIVEDIDFSSLAKQLPIKKPQTRFPIYTSCPSSCHVFDELSDDLPFRHTVTGFIYNDEFLKYTVR